MTIMTSMIDSANTCVLKRPGIINSKEFTGCVKRLRTFFETKGFIEVHPQSRLSILAACEDPTTISTFNYGGEVWPLPQTGQMWLEHELLSNPNTPGFFCVSTSYRNEPNPVEGRHDKIFPMFEFEMKGGMDELINMERELLEYMGFTTPSGDSYYPEGDYDVVATSYQTKELDHAHEASLAEDYGSVFFLKNFPNFTSPFWNMKQSDDGLYANKVDVIIHGMETIGSAERSTNKTEMFDQFYKISDGNYANILFSNFTKDRVEKELNEFLEYDFFPRCGGGIGITRMIRALKMSNLIQSDISVNNEIEKDI